MSKADTFYQCILPEGNKKDWWENETLKMYWEKARCIENQYSAYLVQRFNITNGHVVIGRLNGTNTLGENIADNGGIEAAYRAYGRYDN